MNIDGLLCCHTCMIRCFTIIEGSFPKHIIMLLLALSTLAQSHAAFLHMQLVGQHFGSLHTLVCLRMLLHKFPVPVQHHSFNFAVEVHYVAPDTYTALLCVELLVECMCCTSWAFPAKRSPLAAICFEDR